MTGGSKDYEFIQTTNPFRLRAHSEDFPSIATLPDTDDSVSDSESDECESSDSDADHVSQVWDPTRRGGHRALGT